MRRASSNPFRIRHSKNIFNIDSPFSAEQALGIIRDHVIKTGRHKRIIAVKYGLIGFSHNYGIWGSFIFHTSMIIIALALVINLTWGYKLVFSLTEGEDFDSQRNNWQHANAGWLVDVDKLESVSLFLKSYQAPILANGQMVSPGTAIVVSGKTQDSQTINYGKGTQFDSFGLILTNWGFSPGLRIIDSTGKELLNGFIRLSSKWSDNQRIHRDHINLANGMSLNLQLSDQQLLSVSTKHPENNESTAASLSLRPRTSGSINNLNIIYGGIRQWNQFELQHNPGHFLLYIGFITLIMGLTMRILFSRRVLMISVNQFKHYTSVTISSKSEKYRASYNADLEELVNELEPVLNPFLTPDTEHEAETSHKTIKEHQYATI